MSTHIIQGVPNRWFRISEVGEQNGFLYLTPSFPNPTSSKVLFSLFLNFLTIQESFVNKLKNEYVTDFFISLNEVNDIIHKDKDIYTVLKIWFVLGNDGEDRVLENKFLNNKKQPYPLNAERRGEFDKRLICFYIRIIVLWVHQAIDWVSFMSIYKNERKKRKQNLG